MIKVSNLKKVYQIDGKNFNAVDDVSFEVDKGEIFGIIGLSGAGKSTVIRCINRLDEPTDGKIEIDGVEMTCLNKKELLSKRKDIAMIFQHFNLFNQMTVFENVAYPLKLAKWTKADIEKRVDEMLDFVELKNRKNSYPAELSGGQKQRVAIARALATNPKILLSDEATSALDPSTTKDICDLIKRSAKVYGTTVIIITHQMEVAKDICNRIAVMENGKIIEENEAEELFRNPREKVTRAFIEAIPISEEAKYHDYESKGRLVRLTYDGATADTPIISQISKDFDVKINILSGNINKLVDTSVGYLIVEFIGEDAEIDRTLKYCKDGGINLEVLNV